jgi:hypothetical protein
MEMHTSLNFQGVAGFDCGMSDVHCAFTYQPVSEAYRLIRKRGASHTFFELCF